MARTARILTLAVALFALTTTGCDTKLGETSDTAAGKKALRAELAKGAAKRAKARTVKARSGKKRVKRPGAAKRSSKRNKSKRRASKRARSQRSKR